MGEGEPNKVTRDQMTSPLDLIVPRFELHPMLKNRP